MRFNSSQLPRLPLLSIRQHLLFRLISKEHPPAYQTSADAFHFHGSTGGQAGDIENGPHVIRPISPDI